MMGDGAGGAAGVIVSPDPTTLASTQEISQYNGGNAGSPLGEAQPLTEQTARDEVLTHAENLVLLRRSDPSSPRPETLFGSPFGDEGSLYSSGSRVRSVGDPLGSGNALALILAKEPSGDYPFRNYILGSNVDDLPVFLDAPALSDWQGIRFLKTLTIVNDFLTGLSLNNPSDTLELYAHGGSHVSILSPYIISGSSGGGLNLNGSLAGGTMNLAGSVVVLQSPVNTSVRTGIGVVGFHGGSSMIKADSELITITDIGILSGTPLIGMTHRYQSGGTFLNGYRIRSDAGYASLATPTTGGIITIKAPDRLSHVDNFFPDGGQITANGRSLQGYGGLVKLESTALDISGPETIQANGTVQNGTVITRTLP